MNDFVLGGLILLISFLFSFMLTKLWIKVARRAGIVGVDMNKYNKPKIPEAGGVAVVFSFVFGILLLIFLKTFYIRTSTHFLDLMVILVSILLASFLGFIDDVLGWKVGLKQWQKPLLTIPIAIPLMVINAGYSTMSLPLIGPFNFGILYPLVIIPIGIIGAANGFNMLAGFNGLEAGMGSIILGTLGIVSFLGGGIYWISFVCFLTVASLLGFLFFNKYPSRIFPGDSLTYPIGALIAIVCILGNMERIGLILFIPYFIEFLFKLKTKFRSECFGIPRKDGSLEPPKRIGSLTHIVLKLVRSERETVFVFIFFETLISIILILFVFY